MTLPQQPIIFAHRGASGEAPENTIASFKLALEQKCDGIELDVHLSADNQLIVCHDDTINRTTNGEGYIREKTVDELKKYDGGSWFDEKFHKEKIPLLEEVLDIVPKSVLINIEFKNIPMFYEGIEEKLLHVLIEKNRLDCVVISSFDHKCLYRMKQMNDSVKTGLLYDDSVVSEESLIELFGESDIYSIHPSYHMIQVEGKQTTSFKFTI